MSVFNFMETFFFISLGITFILILLLVYHFKQRLTTIEQKSDTMFDIINNMVKELTVIKTMAAARSMPNPLSQFFEAQRPLNQVFSDSASGHLTDEVKEIYLDESEPMETINLGEKDEDDEEEEDYDDDDDDDDEDVEDVDFDQDDENERVIVSDDEEEVEDKILTLSAETEVVSELTVTKLESEPVEENVNENSTLAQDDAMEEYKKLSPSALKAIILSKGFSTDVGKLKKNQLLQILEDNQ